MKKKPFEKAFNASLQRCEILDEDAYWIARAQAAEASGEWVNHDEAIRLLTQGLKRAK